MIGYRKQNVFGHLVIAAVFVIILFPSVEFIVNAIVEASLTTRGWSLIQELQKAPDKAAMVEVMKTQNEFLFKPLALLDSEGDVIYQSFFHITDQIEVGTLQKTEPAVVEAMQSGKGFSEHVSPFYHRPFYYLALAFNANGEKYLLHVAFPSREIDQLKVYFEFGILIICFLLLIATTILDMIILQYIMRPVELIVDTIRPYKEGKDEFLPRVVLNETMQKGEFGKLASTLNSLTDRIHIQIEDLKRQREETEEILESIGEGIIATDTSAKVTFINRTACRMLEISRETLLKQTLNSVLSHSPELSKKCHELVLDALQTSEMNIHTLTLREKGPLYLDLISAPLAHQNGALLVLQDKTSDYKIIELGKDFIANASHELRTPITIIRGFAETLQDLPELSQEMLHEITEKIVRTCMRLDKLVRSLLTLSDIENLSKDRFRQADLLLMVENCKHHLLASNPSVQISITSDLEFAPIQADADLFELAILNVLENAVKYSSGPVQIEMEIKKVDEEIHLIIKDNGIGISSGDLSHIFDRFYTVDKARSRKSGGAGLGLSIVKTIIEKHRGKINVASELHKGSTFTLILPLHPFK